MTFTPTHSHKEFISELGYEYTTDLTRVDRKDIKEVFNSFESMLNSTAEQARQLTDSENIFDAVNEFSRIRSVYTYLTIFRSQNSFPTDGMASDAFRKVHKGETITLWERSSIGEYDFEQLHRIWNSDEFKLASQASYLHQTVSLIDLMLDYQDEEAEDTLQSIPKLMLNITQYLYTEDFDAIEKEIAEYESSHPITITEKSYQLYLYGLKALIEDHSALPTGWVAKYTEETVRRHKPKTVKE